MLAQIQKVEVGFVARFERHLKHSVQKVWSMLTDNDQLSQWFSELRVEELRVGGLITFDMGNGIFEKMIITELEQLAILEYTWGDDRVRFELYPESDGCKLILIEHITKLTEHSPRDLAGWHVCLDVIQALLDGRVVDFREAEWKEWYEKYVEAVAEYR